MKSEGQEALETCGQAAALTFRMPQSDTSPADTDKLNKRLYHVNETSQS